MEQWYQNAHHNLVIETLLFLPVSSEVELTNDLFKSSCSLIAKSRLHKKQTWNHCQKISDTPGDDSTIYYAMFRVGETIGNF